MPDKKYRNFYLLNITIFVLSSFILFCGFKGDIQDKIELFQHFSINTIKFIFISLVILLLGYTTSFLIIELLNIVPENSKNKKNKIPCLVLGFFLFFIALSLLVLKKWAIDRFPMNKPEMIYFTLKNFRWETVDFSIFYESIKILAICFMISSFLFLPVLIYESNTQYYHISTKRIKNISLNFLWLIFCIILLALSIIKLDKSLNFRYYAEVISVLSKPAIDSDFYKTEYVTPEYKNIRFNGTKKNLIMILLESMESTLADKENGGLLEKNLIPNLTKLADENINFSNTDKIGGGIDLSGTGWTIASMTSKFAGLPFNLYGDENKECSYFLPGAITLTDILAENGYNQRFIFGSDKRFAGRNALLETHGNVEIHDINWYKEKKLLDKNYFEFWGFEDKKLLEFSKDELNSLSSSKEPFMFGLLTVDTHMPAGYKCENCPDSEDMPLKNAILCSDNLISSFIDWCKTQSWYEDTVIVLMGDHLFMATEETNPYENNSYLTAHRLKTELEGMNNNPRRWIDIFINSPLQNEENSFMKNRKFSSFDMFPTILASMGCEIRGNKLGFGVNLFSGEKTLCERYPEEYINKEIMARNKQYESMEFLLEK